MWLTSLLPEKKSRAAHRRARHHGPAPRLEGLEDRSLPSTFTVLNLADAGAGSLRQAVLAANASPGADTIAFASGLNGTLTLSSGEMSITDDLTIGGPGAAQLTLSGNHLSRVFRISGGTTDVAISGLTIAHGRAAGDTALGGGILNDGGRLTLTAMRFTDNHAVGDDHQNAVAGGGAVASINGATLTVTGCTFTGNGCVANRRCEGGAVLSDVGSSLTVAASLFAANQALSLLGAPDHASFYSSGGGAVSTLGGGAATVSATTFTGNRVLGGDGEPGRDGVTFPGGGAISNAGSILADGLGALAGTLQIDHSTFTENEAVGGAGGPSVGGKAGGSGGYGVAGAVYSDVGGRVTITDSAFAGNRARGGDGGHATGTAHGGAGGVAAGGTIASFRTHLVIRRSTFVENQAHGGTGGSSQVQGGNGGLVRGGVIHTPGFGGFLPPGEEGVTEVEDVTFLRNQATGGDGGDGGTGTGGNGNFGRGGALSVNEATLIVRRSLLDGNTASGGQGGAGAVRGQGGRGIGGGISNGEPVVSVGGPAENFLVVTDSILTNNRAIGGAGSVGGLGRGGGIDNAVNATATVTGTLIGNNQAIGGSGTVTGGNGIGGGLYNEYRSDITLRGCTVSANQAIGGSGATAGRGIGGGIYNTVGGTVWVDVATLIIANDASTSDDDVFGTLEFV